MKCSDYAECEVSFGYETHCVCEVHFRHDMWNASLRFVRSTILHSGIAVSLAAERKTWQNRQRLFYILRQNVTQKLTVGTNPSIKNANPSFSYPLAKEKHASACFSLSKNLPMKSFGGRESVKGNRQGSLSRSITPPQRKNCKIIFCFRFCNFESSLSKKSAETFLISCE